MARIPSIEKTDDYIFRMELKKGMVRHPDEPANLVTFEHFAAPTGPLHSIDFITYRDGARAEDLEFLSFDHSPSVGLAFVRLKFLDPAYPAVEHDYLITVILRYLI
jgi:hypothetical protein